MELNYRHVLFTVDERASLIVVSYLVAVYSVVMLH